MASRNLEKRCFLPYIPTNPRSPTITNTKIGKVWVFNSKVFHREGHQKFQNLYLPSNLPLKAIACRRQETFLKMASFEAKIQNELIPTLKASYFQVDEALKWKILKYYKVLNTVPK